ncbi:biopolymer transporter ExbD [Seleniivibrio woodruffii]|uniref:ExbD/TolR family protein n=1 Tax=Seleniivibrio woodruffii TaxID=1078050 RepID=UPI0026EB03B9|nr:biopolymer transporter ExbD [Seleniivibrio woodruffii]
MIDFDIFHKKDSSPDMTPMIDMVFLLLIFFLLTSVFSIPAVKTDLPESTTAQQVKQDELTIAVKSDGSVYLNDYPVDDIHLRMMLGRKLATADEKIVNVSADKSVDFGRIVKVMDIAKESGAESVAFLADDVSGQN